MKLLLSLLIFSSTLCFSQKEGSVWFFRKTGLDFKCNPPRQIFPNSSFFPYESCSSIADSLGNLLFYTDGTNVFDNEHHLMPNGVDIGQSQFVNAHGSSTQGALIVKQPLQDSIYYIFTTDCAENKLDNGFCYSIVNMNLNGGKGDVVIKKQKILNKTCEKLAATRHSNGKDVWILTHEWGNNLFYAYLLTNSGLVLTPVVSMCGRIQFPTDSTDNYPYVPYPEAAARGQLKFSTLGNRFVVLSTSDFNNPSKFQSYPEMFSFNKTSGNVSFDYNINTNDSTIYYAASFSPNGNVLYLSSGWYGNYLHQFDLSSNNPISIASSRTVIYKKNNPAALQVGHDGKLYNITLQGINVISYPNNIGLACGFNENEIQLCGHELCNWGLPNIDESIYSNFSVGDTCLNDSLIINFSTSDSCINSPIYFFDESFCSSQPLFEWWWDFGEPYLEFSQNISQIQNPQHTYTNPGTYQVKLKVYTHLECIIDSIFKTVYIYDCQSEISDNNISREFLNIYPNPTKKTLYISSSFLITSIKVLNLEGQLVFEKQSNSGIFKIDLNLSPGMYILNFSNKNFHIFKKLVLTSS